MFNILIADDEPIIREGLMDLVDWENLGFNICAVATDGDDALEKIMTHHPDVVLIDIKMPGLTGIDVMKKTRAAGIDCAFVVLSGYSDFEYAKEAIHLNVFDYLLKPITQKDLLAALENVHERLSNKQDMSDKLKKYQQFQHDERLLGLLKGEGVEDEKNKYQLAYLKSVENDGFITMLKAQFAGLHVLSHSEGIVLFFQNSHPSKVHEMLLKYGKMYEIKITLSPPEITCVTMKKTYEHLKQLMYGFFCFKDKYVLTEEMLQGENVEKIDIDSLYLAIEFCDHDVKMTALNQLEKKYTRHLYTPDHIRGRLSNFQALLFQKFNYHYPNLDFSSSLMQHHFQDEDTLQDILVRMMGQWRVITEGIKKEIDETDDSVAQVQHYVKRYYHQELSLKIVAKILNYNATYLGKKFKTETGGSFSKYVDRIRIEKAKIYLTRDKAKVYEVSEKVGYCHIDYFYRKFKNHTGISPKEWQKQHLSKQEDA